MKFLLGKLSPDYPFYLFLFFIYFISFGIRIFHEGYYWDDFAYIWSSPNEVMYATQQEARILFSYFHKFVLLSSDPILLYKSLSVSFEFFSGIFFYFTLQKISLFRKNTNQILSILFLILSIYQSRDSLVLSHYSLSLFTFWAGIYFFSSQAVEPAKAFKQVFLLLFASILLFISYGVESALPYSVALVSLIALVLYKKKKITVRNFIIPGFIFFILVIIKIIFRFHLFPGDVVESNPYQHQFDWYLVLKSILRMPTFLAHPFRQVWELSIFSIPLFTVVFLLFYYFMKNKEFVKEIDKKDMPLYFFIGFFLILTALFPPWLMGKATTVYDWGSRHQLFYGFGEILILWAFLNLIHKSKTRKLVFILLCSIFITVNISQRIYFFRDWLKLEFLGSKLNNVIVKDNTGFYFLDKNEKDNSLKRTYRYYEMAGLLEKYGLTEENRLIIRKSEVNSFDYRYVKNPILNIGNLKKDVEFTYEIELITLKTPSFYESLRHWISTGGKLSNVQNMNLEKFYKVEFRKL